MRRLSPKLQRIDQAVRLAAEHAYDHQRDLKNLHFSRPSKFAEHLSRLLPVTPSVRGCLDGDDLGPLSDAERVAEIERSLRRLVRRHVLRKDHLMVPVHLKSLNKIEDRPMVCYWPSTVLEKMARV
jgi:AraC-like DNA-binding protein